jgi:hypothetical protein
LVTFKNTQATLHAGTETFATGTQTHRDEQRPVIAVTTGDRADRTPGRIGDVASHCRYA